MFETANPALSSCSTMYNCLTDCRGRSRGSEFENFSFRERQMRLRTGMSETSLEAERGPAISPPPPELRRAVSAVRQRGPEVMVQRSASRMHERLGPQQTRWVSVICTGSFDRHVLAWGRSGDLPFAQAVLTMVCLLGAAADQVEALTCAHAFDHCVLLP